MHRSRSLRFTLLVLGLLLLGGAPHPQAQVSVAIQQGAINSTTLSLALPGQLGGSSATTMVVASITLGSPNVFVVGNYALVDSEVVRIMAIGSSASVPVTIARGQFGTTAVSHPTASTVYVGPGYQFQSIDPPFGSCGSATTSFVPTSSPWINTKTAAVWQCSAGVWQNITDAYQWIPPSSCTASGSTATAQTNYGVNNTVTSLGLVGMGASFTPVYQYASTAGTSHNYACAIPIPSRVNATRGVYLMDATFYYGVQQTVLPTQAATLATGLFNGQAVFTSVTLPIAGAAETASTVVPVRADAGTLTITPPVASFNLGLTTAGAFDSVKFVPATPLGLTTDLTAYFLNVNFLVTSGAMTTNTPGWHAHYRFVSEGHAAR